MSIKSRVEAAVASLTAILSKANATTAAGDTDIDSAVDTLIAGYGGGGGGGGWYEATWVSPSTASNKEVVVATSDELKAQRSNSTLMIMMQYSGSLPGPTADTVITAIGFNGSGNSGCSGFAVRYAIAVGSYGSTRLYGKTLDAASSWGAGGLRIDTNGNLLYSATSGSFGVAQGSTYKIRAAWTTEA